MSDLCRKLIYRLSPSLKHLITDAIALLVYWPLAVLSRVMERMGLNVATMELPRFHGRFKGS